MIRAVFVRSGESILEAQQRLRGWIDTALTDNGRQDARKLALAFRDLRFDHAYASSLQRAQEVAAIILQELKQEVAIDAQVALKPRDWGLLNGWNINDVITHFGQNAYDSWRSGAAPPGGESLPDVLERVAPFVQTLLTVPRDRTLLIACHDSVLAAVRAWEHRSRPTHTLNELRRAPFLIFEF